ncbi:MAG: hypothetical protein NTU89_02365 [Candidatus Dependentiae bacterium]|nr:hypothetical protein [Candidatus Dependentiae bacterium]
MKKSKFLVIASLINFASAPALGMNAQEVSAIIEKWCKETTEASRISTFQRQQEKILLSCAKFVSECELELTSLDTTPPINENEGIEGLTKLEVMLREMHDHIQAPSTPDIVKIKNKSIINILESFSQPEVEGLSSQQIEDKVKHIQAEKLNRSLLFLEKEQYNRNRRGY